MGRRRSKITRIGHWLALGLVLGAVGSAAFVYIRWLVRERRYNKLIEQIAPQYGVDKFLVKAVMRQESGFDPFARSKTGAIGLMQIMPSSGRLIGVGEGQLWNERTNIQAGACLLADALAFWRRQGVDDPVPFALAEYNGGRGAALRWAGPRRNAAEFIAALPVAGVRHYINRVLRFHEDYRSAGRL